MTHIIMHHSLTPHSDKQGAPHSLVCHAAFTLLQTHTLTPPPISGPRPIKQTLDSDL